MPKKKQREKKSRETVFGMVIKQLLVFKISGIGLRVLIRHGVVSVG